MTTRTNTDQLRPQAVGHPDEVREVYERILADAGVGHRYIETRSGRRIHPIEAGEGPPVVLIHGGGTSSLSRLPFLAHLEGVRGINADRPGFGPSDPTRVPGERYREGAIAFIDEVVNLPWLGNAERVAERLAGFVRNNPQHSQVQSRRPDGTIDRCA